MDLSAGQAIDRAGVMMGMPFPSGRMMEIAASGFSGMLPPCENQRGWDALQFFRTSKFVAKTVS